MADGLTRLVGAHTASQQRLAAAIAALLRRTYAQQVTTLKDPVVERWIEQMLPYLRDYRARSSGQAAAFYRQARVLGQAGTAGMPDLSPVAIDDEAIRTSLRVTGLSEAIKSLEAGNDFGHALKVGQIAVSGAGMRHTLDGGRDLLGRAWSQDTVRIGAYRVTQPGCCAFCAMLASRGAVYASDSFDASDPRFEGALSDVKVHDHDRCGLGFVFESAGAVPDFNLKMAELWRQVTRDDQDRLLLHGKDAANAFRRAYEAQLRA